MSIFMVFLFTYYLSKITNYLSNYLKIKYLIYYKNDYKRNAKLCIALS